MPFAFSFNCLKEYIDFLCKIIILYIHQIDIFMAEANVFFLYDIDTEELLGFAAFEGSFKGLRLSEDEKGFEMDVENYRFIPFEGSITPTIKDGVLYLGIYEILSKCDSTAVDVEVIPLPCGPHPKFFAELMIPRFAEQARSELENHRKEVERRAKQLVSQMMLTVLSSSTNKWSS